MAYGVRAQHDGVNEWVAKDSTSVLIVGEADPSIAPEGALLLDNADDAERVIGMYHNTPGAEPRSLYVIEVAAPVASPDSAPQRTSLGA